MMPHFLSWLSHDYHLRWRDHPLLVYAILELAVHLYPSFKLKDLEVASPYISLFLVQFHKFAME
jgi:hypothetical protein